MEKSDIKQALKTVKEFEGTGSFLMGVGVVSLLFIGGIFAIHKARFNGFMRQPDQGQVSGATPSPHQSEFTQLPEKPNLYQKDGQWFVQGLPATYTVKTGDSSWKVALAVYGAGENYRDIESENGMKINQDLVVGQKIKLPNVPSKATNVSVLPTFIPTATSLPVATIQPTSTPVSNTNQSLPTKHTVQKSEGLWQIAQKYYNDGNRYLKIYEANRDKMKNPEDINEGMELTIPQL